MWSSARALRFGSPRQGYGHFMMQIMWLAVLSAVSNMQLNVSL
jgi:hypothetical protein